MAAGGPHPAVRLVRLLMQRVTFAFVELSDILAVARNEISILQQTTREIRSIVALCDGAGADSLVRQSLDEIDARMAAALVRQRFHASILDQLGGELRSAERSGPSSLCSEGSAVA
jgi:hypothetical protein